MSPVDDRTPEWRRGMEEAAEICRDYANAARSPSPFNDGWLSVERAEAYELAEEVVRSRLTLSSKLRAEEGRCATEDARLQAGGISDAQAADDREVEDIERMASAHSVLHWPGILRIIARMRAAEASSLPSRQAPAGSVTVPVEPTRGEVETAAQRIYEHWNFGPFGAPATRPQEPKPAWVPNGNSTMQGIARDFARAAMLAASPVASGDAGGAWRPIATAPKDGTDVLLHVPGRVSVVAAWYGGWQPMDIGGNYLRGEPTHWQSLPSPPPASDGE